MGVDWELVKSEPDAAEHGVLLLPGGANAARSYSGVMAQPVLAGTRLVAATLPGNVGTPPPTDFSIENYARLAAELAATHKCDVVVGFSMGASVALEMAASGTFKGPLVLLGISLSQQDEPAFFRAIVRLGTVLGGLPSAMLMRLTAIAVRTARVSDEHRAQMRADFRSNDPRVLRSGLRAYLEYLGRHESPAKRLCDTRMPTWIVHAEKGDGGLTDEERRALEACPRTNLITIPAPATSSPTRNPSEWPRSLPRRSVTRNDVTAGTPADDLLPQCRRRGSNRSTAAHEPRRLKAELWTAVWGPATRLCLRDCGSEQSPQTLKDAGDRSQCPIARGRHPRRSWDAAEPGGLRLPAGPASTSGLPGSDHACIRISGKRRPLSGCRGDASPARVWDRPAHEVRVSLDRRARAGGGSRSPLRSSL